MASSFPPSTPPSLALETLPNLAGSFVTFTRAISQPLRTLGGSRPTLCRRALNNIRRSQPLSASAHTPPSRRRLHPAAKDWPAKGCEPTPERDAEVNLVVIMTDRQVTTNVETSFDGNGLPNDGRPRSEASSRLADTSRGLMAAHSSWRYCGQVSYGDQRSFQAVCASPELSCCDPTDRAVSCVVMTALTPLGAPPDVS